MARGAARVLVTDGSRPVAEAMVGAPVLTYAPPTVTVARVTGAGDCFLAAHLAAELAGQPRDAALRQAAEAAAGSDDVATGPAAAVCETDDGLPPC